MYARNFRLPAVLISSLSLSTTVSYGSAHRLSYYTCASSFLQIHSKINSRNSNSNTKSVRRITRTREFLRQIVGSSRMPCDAGNEESFNTPLNMVQDNEYCEDIFWKPGTQLPSELADGSDPFLSGLVPRPTAWISVQDEHGGECKVALLEGYNCANDKPPTMIFGAESIPSDILTILKENKLCCLSLTHEGQLDACKEACVVKDANESCGSSYSFEQLGFQPAVIESRRPAGVQSSMIRLHCSLLDYVDLDENDKRKGLVILEVDTFDIERDVLRAVPTAKKAKSENVQSARVVTASIDAKLMKPIGSLGQGKFGKLDGPYHMYRPKGAEKDGEKVWTNDSFVPRPPVESTGLYHNSVQFSYVKDPQCSLGYNPTKQTTQPRPIGWISTFKPGTRIEHLAPYSFFIDVARGNRPMVAFVSMMRNRTERKDAQTDSEDNGVFAWNVVTRELAEVMNYSSADLKSSESEFELIGMKGQAAKLIDAPIVAEAPIVFECKYVKSKPTPTRTDSDLNWTIVVGEVIGIKIKPSILTDGHIDTAKLHPVARLGYEQEYGLVEELE